MTLVITEIGSQPAEATAGSTTLSKYWVLDYKIAEGTFRSVVKFVRTRIFVQRVTRPSIITRTIHDHGRYDRADV